MLATLALLALARGTAPGEAASRSSTLAVGTSRPPDSAYVYLTSTEAYSSASFVTGGWVAGFLLVAAAGLGVRRPAPWTRTQP